MAQSGLWLWVKYEQFKNNATYHHGSVTPDVWYKGEKGRVISIGKLKVFYQARLPFLSTTVFDV